MNLDVSRELFSGFAQSSLRSDSIRYKLRGVVRYAKQKFVLFLFEIHIFIFLCIYKDIMEYLLNLDITLQPLLSTLPMTFVF